MVFHKTHSVFIIFESYSMMTSIKRLLCINKSIYFNVTISQKSLVPYLSQRHTMGHINSLLVRFPISGCTYLSLQLVQRRWQKWYCSCQGDGYVHRCHSRTSTSTCTWGAHSACGHLEPHGGCHSSCCLSKSKTENNKRAKEILNKNDSFFQTSCP
jgi:hypothetical protein